MRIARLRHTIMIASTLVLLTSALHPAVASKVIELTGAGASMPAPLYKRWFRDYSRSHPNVIVDYQAIGSGAGMKHFLAGRLDFAGLDALTKKNAARIEDDLLQIPLTVGAVVMAYNLPGIKSLQLSREALAGIFLGEVERWNAPLIQETNQGIDLPDMPITLIVRSGTSGTTFAATRHLSAISERFRKTVGSAMTPQWPWIIRKRGSLIHGQGNGGVAAYIKSLPGAIGYIENAYALIAGLKVASLQNRAGELVAPDTESLNAAVNSFRSEFDPPDLADPRGVSSYPIVALSWVITRKSLEPKKAQALREVLRYCLTEGQKTAGILGYAPLTEKEVGKVLEQLATLDVAQ